MTPEERDNLPMRQSIHFEVTAKQLRTMDIAADARGLNLSQFMLQAAIDVAADDEHWADTNRRECICLWSEACNEIDGFPRLLEIDDECKVHSAKAAS